MLAPYNTLVLKTEGRCIDEMVLAPSSRFWREGRCGGRAAADELPATHLSGRSGGRVAADEGL